MPKQISERERFGQESSPLRPKIISKPVEPAEAIGVIDSGRPSLQSQMCMGSRKTQFAIICHKLRLMVKKHLDLNQTRIRQDPDTFDNFMYECSKMSELAAYEDCWPAEVYAKRYLLNANTKARRQSKFAETRQSSPVRNEDYMIPISDRPSVLRQSAHKRQGTPRSDIVEVVSSSLGSNVSALLPSTISQIVAATVAFPSHPTPSVSGSALGVKSFLNQLRAPLDDDLLTLFYNLGMKNMELLHAVAQCPCRDDLFAALVAQGQLSAVQCMFILEGMNKLVKKTNRSLTATYAAT